MRSYGKIFLALCLAGFVGGILYANTGARDHILAAGIFSDYFLEQYTQAEIQTQDYFWYILSVRAGLLGVIALMGQMKKLRRWIVAAVLVWTGFLGGLFFYRRCDQAGTCGDPVLSGCYYPSGAFLYRRVRNCPLVFLFFPQGIVEFGQNSGYYSDDWSWNYIGKLFKSNFSENISKNNLIFSLFLRII